MSHVRCKSALYARGNCDANMFIMIFFQLLFDIAASSRQYISLIFDAYAQFCPDDALTVVKVNMQHKKIRQ